MFPVTYTEFSKSTALNKSNSQDVYFCRDIRLLWRLFADDTRDQNRVSSGFVLAPRSRFSQRANFCSPIPRALQQWAVVTDASTSTEHVLCYENQLLRMNCFLNKILSATVSLRLQTKKAQSQLLFSLDTRKIHWLGIKASYFKNNEFTQVTTTVCW